MAQPRANSKVGVQSRCKTCTLATNAKRREKNLRVTARADWAVNDGRALIRMAAA